MSESLEQRLARIGDEAEVGERDQTMRPIPPHVKVSRPNKARGKVLQIRLTDAEYTALEAIGARQDLQVSAFARGELLRVVARDQVDTPEVVALLNKLVVTADRLRSVVGHSSLAAIARELPIHYD